MYFKGLQLFALLSSALLVSGCAYNPLFGFPVGQGDIDAGRQAFVDHQCHQCHGIRGLTMPELAGASPVMLELGGETISVRTYAELVTSVINPDHIISERYRDQLRLDAIVPLDSPMPTPNLDNMTVQQLLDIVAFLDSRYILIEGYEPGY